ncbi:hypothetical protein C488_20692 [Natrinema pellirubrum DSM 15624]|uniref:DUF8128 domain-containing protein n=1 Tax=Natrinema pellirubrum (strain DSM 15624 / CIP 106293 / JCM 10476 / NCIMB 786 / 157) TaxID=797303 RepID=L0JRU1_NATP1|nr:hypothetical protein [Natrinema pellirubrum]AGB33959.1 hypothetical protein Natpe_4256 [Natrinema pellirubrum DSM 15624]ELY69144.1 hypothetical protein C488_20692 [Natrinema pellirubrum DSM 15624]
MINRLFGGTSQYDATQLPIEEPLVQQPADAPGILLRIRPFKENQGVVDGAGLLQSVHDVTTNFRGKNTSDHHSFEVWFDEGKITFYMHAATEAAADKFRRRVGNNYANSEVFPVDGGVAFPVIDPDEYVAGAWLEMEKLPYYPIRHHNSDEWANDPYGEITSEMLTLDDSTVVTQVVFRPAKQSWTDGDRFKHNSVDDLAHALRQGTSVGWLNPRTRPASEKDKQAAETIEQQRGQQAFHVNIRVLAASTDKDEAEARARGVAGMFRKYYNAITEQGLDDTPVWHRKDGKRAKQLRQHVTRMADREWTDRRMIMTVDELAGVAHIPNNEIETPNIDWRYTQRGDRVPADTDQYEQSATRHRSDERPARQGGEDRV